MPEHIADDWKRLKETGGTRASRIRSIVRQALSEALNEVRDGSGEVRQIVKKSVSTTFDASQPNRTTVVSVDSTSDSVSYSQSEGADVEPSDVVVIVEVDDRKETSTSNRSLFEQFMNWFQAQQFGSLQEQYQSFKVRMEDWDRQLTDRYGDRYQVVKNRANDAKVWYQETKAKVDAGEESPGDRFQRQLDTNAQVVGTSAAQTETLVKQRVQAWWKERQSSNSLDS
jgi:hypothetical protein